MKHIAIARSCLNLLPLAALSALMLACGPVQRNAEPGSDMLPATPAGLEHLPGLPGPDAAASPTRRASDTDVAVDGTGRIAEGGANNVAGGDGTYSIIPGSEDELAWALYRVPDLNTERPVEIEISAQSVIPGSEDELAYYVLLSDYSSFQWEPHGPYTGPVTLTLNSEEVRERYVSKLNGANEPAFSYVIATSGNADNNMVDPPADQPRIEIQTAATTMRGVAEETYLATKPHFTPFLGVSGGIEGGTAGDPVTFTFEHINDDVAEGKNEAVSYEISRDDLTPGSAPSSAGDEVIGMLDPTGSETTLTYADPTDNSGEVLGPAPLHRYRYYVRASSVAGAQGNWQQLGSEVTIPFQIAVDTAGNVGQHTSIALVGGAPAIAYVDVDNQALKYVRASISGENWDPPSVVDAAIGADGGTTTLLMADGKPVISYRAAGQLMFVRSQDNIGVNWEVPQPLSASTAGAGAFARMCLVAGNPAISYIDADAGKNLMYIRAADAGGLAWGAAQSIDPAAAGGVAGTSLAIIGGNPAIAYADVSLGAVRYVRAVDTTGALTWSLPATAASANDAASPSLAEVNGRPAVSYFTEQPLTSYHLSYVRADDAAGANWPAGDQNLRSNTLVGYTYITLFVRNGIPLVAYRLNGGVADGGLKLISAADPDGAVWPGSNDVYIHRTNRYGSFNSVTSLLDGSLGFSYYDATNDDLLFAIYNPE